jgi:hypothetical protein
MKVLNRIRELSNIIREKQFKVKRKSQPFTEKERRRLSSLRSCLNNIKEEGFIGGESGVSPNHLQRECEWLESNISRWYPNIETGAMLKVGV